MKEVKVFLQRCILVACEINRLNLEVNIRNNDNTEEQRPKQLLSQPKLESTNSSPQKQQAFNREQNNRIIALRKQLNDAENKLSQKEATLKQIGPENAMLKEKIKNASKASQETEKIYQKYHNIVSLYNKLASDNKYQKRELESLKSSQSSGAFINKIKKEVEDHQSTKATLSDLNTKYDALLKEHEALKRTHLKSIIFTPNQNGGNAEETISSPSKGESNEQNSCNSKYPAHNNIGFAEILEKTDLTRIPAEIIEAFKAEIKRRDDRIELLNQDNQEIMRQLKESNNDLEKIQEDNDVARRFNSSVTDQNLVLKTENAKLAEKIASLLEQIDEISCGFRKSRDEFDYKMENLQKINAELSHTNNGLQYELSQQEVNRRRDQCTCTSTKNSIQTQNQVINELKSQLCDLKAKLQTYEAKKNSNVNNGKSINDSLSLTQNKNPDTYSSDHLTNRLVELNAEIEMKDKLVRFFMTGYPDIDLKNFFNDGKNMTHASFVNIYNESITKMQKILEEQLLKNIDLDQNLSRVILENSLLNEELEKARAILNAN